MKTCVVCGKEINSMDRRRKTCCKECSEVLAKETRARAFRKYYEKKKDEPDYKDKRRAIALDYWNYRYKNDPEFNVKMKEKALKNYYKRKEKEE